ncbi:PREDICTED: adenylate cyclase type 7-like [Nicrophorus vespilloides]|uniref:adenylate cyclase n=1 Tax=Nicrophorus vespilloides TaxID=110193 RepID=A0ABM1N4V8_NICVS|nr:PREDICTED: adenylate cyclase type 7-like [Nicrophorus vespilloides]
MIEIIKRVRKSRKLDINMRIGIHSGSILSGIIGIAKWQSKAKDVHIANKFESTASPG